MEERTFLSLLLTDAHTHTHTQSCTYTHHKYTVSADAFHEHDFTSVSNKPVILLLHVWLMQRELAGSDMSGIEGSYCTYSLLNHSSLSLSLEHRFLCSVSYSLLHSSSGPQWEAQCHGGFCCIKCADISWCNWSDSNLWSDRIPPSLPSYFFPAFSIFVLKFLPTIPFFS